METLAELPKGTLVLHVGDSFAASLGVPLGRRFKAAGVHYILEFETSSYVPTWAFGEALPKYVGRYNPDLVMVTLGANEIEVPNPEQRAGAVKRLVKHLGARPCVWVLPPLWKADTGFMKVIRESSAPCRVVDSTALVGDLPRRRDKIHPNEEGREVWADAVFGWLGRELEGTSERPWAFRAP
jgi:lysophospholipase L1-like esterase